MGRAVPVTFLAALAACAAALLSVPAAGATGTSTLAPAQRTPLIASSARCPGQADLGAVPAAQVRAMRCLVNAARRGRGLSPLAGSAALDRAAGRKSADILRCDEFSHEACDREFTYWMQHFGLPHDCASAENIAWGSGSLGTVRAIFSAWMKSPGHRENILGPYAQIGIGLRTGSLEGVAGAHVWTQDFSVACTRRAMH